MNADLMRSTRFQTTFHKRENPNFFHDAHMRDRVLSLSFYQTAAAAAVSPISD
jgi:hypothetical protein